MRTQQFAFISLDDVGDDMCKKTLGDFNVDSGSIVFAVICDESSGSDDIPPLISSSDEKDGSELLHIDQKYCEDTVSSDSDDYPVFWGPMSIVKDLQICEQVSGKCSACKPSVKQKARPESRRQRRKAQKGV